MDAGEIHTLEAAHAEYYLALPRAWIPGIYGNRDVELAGPLAQERANLVTALEWMVVADRPSDAAVVFECVVLALMDLRRSECFGRAAAVVDRGRAGRDDVARARTLSAGTRDSGPGRGRPVTPLLGSTAPSNRRRCSATRRPSPV